MADNDDRNVNGEDSGDESSDKWDELMAKLDDISETLRKACEQDGDDQDDTQD